MPNKIKRTKRKKVNNHRLMKRKKMNRKTVKRRKMNRKTVKRKTKNNNSLIIANRYKVIKRLNNRKYSGGDNGWFSRFKKCIGWDCDRQSVNSQGLDVSMVVDTQDVSREVGKQGESIDDDDTQDVSRGVGTLDVSIEVGKQGESIDDDTQEELITRYGKINRLGQGAQGEVYLVKDTRKGNIKRALKIGTQKYLKKEFDYMRSLMKFKNTNPGKYGNIKIVKAHALGKLEDEIVSNYKGRSLRFNAYLVIDYINGTDLHELNKSSDITKTVLKNYFYQITRVVDMMHSMSKPLYHNDIKPENIMIGIDGNAYLIDFGLCGTDIIESIYIGTPMFSPPLYIELRKKIRNQERFVLKGVYYNHDVYSIMFSIIDVIYEGSIKDIEIVVESIENNEETYSELKDMILGIMYCMPKCIIDKSNWKIVQCDTRGHTISNIELIQNIEGLLENEWIQGGNPNKSQ